MEKDKKLDKPKVDRASLDHSIKEKDKALKSNKPVLKNEKDHHS
jgi:hypothetical protein